MEIGPLDDEDDVFLLRYGHGEVMVDCEVIDVDAAEVIVVADEVTAPKPPPRRKFAGKGKRSWAEKQAISANMHAGKYKKSQLRFDGHTAAAPYGVDLQSAGHTAPPWTAIRTCGWERTL